MTVRPGSPDSAGLPWPLARDDRHTDGMAAALLSFFVPGAGQLLAGRHVRGALIVGVFLLLVGVPGGVAVLNRPRLLGLLVRPGVLGAVLALDLAVLLYRVLAVLDAYRCGAAASAAPRPATGVTGRPGPRGGPPHRAAPSWLAAAPALAVLMVVTAVPHLAVAVLGLQARSTLDTVFAAPEPADDLHAAGGPGGAAGAAGPAGAGRPGGTRGPLPERLAFLLVGVDAGPLRSGRRADTVMVAVVEPSGARAVLFGIPRNLAGIPLRLHDEEGWTTQIYTRPLNTLLAFGDAHPEAFPEADDPGVAALARAVEGLLGLDVDHHALVDLAGFVAVVDALGGVEVTITEGIDEQLDSPVAAGAWDRLDLPAGRHHLNGQQALVYVRSRRGISDYRRMGRQRCVLRSLAAQADPGRLLPRLPRLLAALRDSVTTDVPVDLLPALVDLLPEVRRTGIDAVALTPPRFSYSYTPEGFPLADIPAIQRAVREALAPPAGRAARSDSRAAPTPQPDGPVRAPGEAAPACP